MSDIDGDECWRYKSVLLEAFEILEKKKSLIDKGLESLQSSFVDSFVKWFSEEEKKVIKEDKNPSNYGEHTPCLPYRTLLINAVDGAKVLKVLINKGILKPDVIWDFLAWLRKRMKKIRLV